jgi:hypothetical protein
MGVSIRLPSSFCQYLAKPLAHKDDFFDENHKRALWSS